MLVVGCAGLGHPAMLCYGGKPVRFLSEQRRSKVEEKGKYAIKKGQLKERSEFQGSHKLAQGDGR